MERKGANKKQRSDWNINSEQNDSLSFRLGGMGWWGGGRKSNCSIIEAINTIYKFTNISIKKELKRQNRVGDHIWYISNMKKFKNHYPKWKQIYNSEKIIDELLSSR